MMSAGVNSARSGPQYATDGPCYRRGGLRASKTFTFFGAILFAATTASTQKHSWVEAVRATGGGRTDHVHVDGATNDRSREPAARHVQNEREGPRASARSTPRPASSSALYSTDEAEAEGPLQGLLQQFRGLAVSSVSQGRPFLSSTSSLVLALPSVFCLGVGIPNPLMPRRQSTPRTWAAVGQGDNGAGLEAAARGNEGLLDHASSTSAAISSMCCVHYQGSSPHSREGEEPPPSASASRSSSRCPRWSWLLPWLQEEAGSLFRSNKFNVLQALLEQEDQMLFSENIATFLEPCSFPHLSGTCRTMRTTLQDWIRALGWWRLVRFLAKEEEQEETALQRVLLPWVMAGAPPGDDAIRCHMDLERKRQQEQQEMEMGTPGAALERAYSPWVMAGAPPEEVAIRWHMNLERLRQQEQQEMEMEMLAPPHPPPRWKSCDFKRGNIPVYNFQTKSFIHCEKDAATSGSGAGGEHGASGSDSPFPALDTDTAGERYVERAAASSVSAVGISSSPVSPQTQRTHEDQAAWPGSETLIDYLYAIDGIGKDLASSLQQTGSGVEDREGDPSASVRLFHAMRRQLDYVQKQVANEQRSDESEASSSSDESEGFAANMNANSFLPIYTYLLENTHPVAPSPPGSSKWELIELTWDTFPDGYGLHPMCYTADQYEGLLLHLAPTSVTAYFAPSDVARSCADITEPRLRFLCFRALRGGINARHQRSTSATQQERRARGPSAGTPPAPRGQETPFEAANMLDAEAENCSRGGADQLHQEKSERQALLKASAALHEFGTAGNLLQVDIVMFQKSIIDGVTHADELEGENNSRNLLHTIRAQMFEWGGDMEGFKVPGESGNGPLDDNEKRAEKGWRVRGSHVGEGDDTFYAPLAAYVAHTNFLVHPPWLRWKILLVRDDGDTLRRMLRRDPLDEDEIEERLRHAYGERQRWRRET